MAPTISKHLSQTQSQKVINRETRESLLIVDAHVHIHQCFDLSKFFSSAFANCQAQAQVHHVSENFSGMMLLTESSWDHWFQVLKSMAEKNESLQTAHSDRWRFFRTDESYSVIARSHTGAKLFLLAGRQIVTKEKLEVLALMTDETFPEGESIQDSIDLVHHAGGIPVIPWGFGKWWGERGKILTELIEKKSSLDFFLGDNSGRPSFLPYPPQFDQGIKKGLQILPGSDPLPFASEFWRPCSVGLTVTGWINDETPGIALKNIFREKDKPLSPYMKMENFPRFCKNQIAMQMVKHQR